MAGRSTMMAMAWMIAVPLCAGVVEGQSGWRETFEGPQTSWREAGGDVRYRVLQHQRIQGDAHSGNGCEWLQLQGDGGSAVYIGHDVGRPQIIEEMAVAVWLKADRPGLQLMARVVLPRTQDPHTGQPLWTLIGGSNYTNVGRWQQLEIADLPRLVARQTRVMRSQLRALIDEREAYVESVVLNVYGGPGVTNVWIDDLDVAGFVGLPPQTREPAVHEAALSRSVAGPSATAVAATEPPPQRRVRLEGSLLTVDERPFFPRIIQYQGEPLALLRQLGFNAVWLERIPSAELLEEAKRVHLWLVCPPPLASSDSPGATAAPPPLVGPQFDAVLAWNLGLGLFEQDLESTKRCVQQLRAADRAAGRPLVCGAENDLRGFSRQVDLLLMDRRPLGTSLELTDYVAWLRQQPRLARPGTPIWTTVQTQPSPGLVGQLGIIEPGRKPPSAVPDEQVRLLAYTAVAAGSRGLLLLSDSPLTADNPETRQRAMTLELLNLEMELVELWGAAGSTFEPNVEANEPQVIATELCTVHARLLLPIWLAAASQYVPAQSAAAALSLKVPGVPESSKAYQLTPGGMETLRSKRVTGGTHVTLNEFGLTGLVLFAQDSPVINSLSQRASAIGRRAAELRRELATRKLQVVDEVAAELGGRSRQVKQLGEWMAAARQSLRLCDTRLGAREYPAAYLAADQAMRAMRLVERSYWEKAVEGLPSPLTSPCAASFATLPSHWRLASRVAASRPGPNRLAGGDFEDLGLMMQAGWRHFQHPTLGIQTAAELLPEAAHSGARGLRLTARAGDPATAPAIVETPPVWITTAPVPVEAGQLVCIHGWAAIPAPITGSVDGLMIVDSLAGEDMAVRINKTSNWQEFTIYRAVPRSGPMTVTFVLSGLGEVRLDDVSIQVLEAAAGAPAAMAPAVRGGVSHLPPL